MRLVEESNRGEMTKKQDARDKQIQNGGMKNDRNDVPAWGAVSVI
jgi:hypothetical protein